MTPFIYFGDLCEGVVGPHGKDVAPKYRQALREIVAESKHTNLHLIEGSELMPDVHGFTMDLTHPGDFGMMQIGENLAQQIQRLLAQHRS